MKLAALIALACAAVVSARVIPTRRAVFTLQNGEDAITLNQKFTSLTPDSPCTPGENACVQAQFAQCVGGKFVLQPCGSGLVCAALPLVNSAGTSITCTTAADRDARIAATGATSASGSSTSSVPASSPSATKNARPGSQPANNNSSDPQTSFTLDPAVIASAFAKDGQDTNEPGQVPSLTSPNNFINHCLTVPNLPITNGKQIKTGSCNPAPMGIIAAAANIPSVKFQFPTLGTTIPASKTFTVSLLVSHLDTGHFTNADTNFLAAPQQVNEAGDIIGHTHIVIEKLQSLSQTTPTDPTQFAFFKGVNAVAQNGILTVDVTNGLPAGFYRIATMNAAANHQPVLVAIAQHGSTDDMVYFAVQS